MNTALNGKQNTLTAGTGITISNDVISATGGGGSNNIYIIYEDTPPADVITAIESNKALYFKLGEESLPSNLSI